jgi:hypothetical protein
MNLTGLRASPWLVIDGHCATRVNEGGDPSRIQDRIALIEKTPRVLAGDTWEYGPKGSGGFSEDPERDQLYGFDPKSRAWADQRLLELGVVLPPLR